MGFAIEYKEPEGIKFFPLKNRLGFRGTAGDVNPNKLSTRLSPIQKFRWVHFPRNAELDGEFVYRVTPVFMNDADRVELRRGARGRHRAAARDLSRGSSTSPSPAALCLRRLSWTDTQSAGPISTLLPAKAADGTGLRTDPSQGGRGSDVDGFRSAQCDPPGARPGHRRQEAKVCVVAYDLNEPDLVSRLEKLGSRLRIIIDDSADHGDADSGETQAATRLAASAGAANVKRQHMLSLQHNKIIVVDGPQGQMVACGSTNFSWRGFFVQSNNAMILQGASALKPFLAAFEDYWSLAPADFGAYGIRRQWTNLGLTGIDARVAFSPHGPSNALLSTIADDIGEQYQSHASSSHWRSSTRPRVRFWTQSRRCRTTTRSSSMASPTGKSVVSICRSRMATSRLSFLRR